MRTTAAILLLAASIAFAQEVPSDPAALEAKLREDLSLITQKILFYNRAAWLPGVEGYGFASMVHARQVEKRGYVVLDDEGLHFAIWNNGAFKRESRLQYHAINSLEIKSFGPSTRLVMRANQGNEAFALDIGSATRRIDNDETKKACAILAERTQKPCKEE